MVVARVRKWGNSLGIVLPKDFSETKRLNEGDEVFISEVVKVTDLSDVFGKVKTGRTGQEFKDEARKGWREKRFSSTATQSTR